MILSPKHNFLLIKNYKVGGTSLEIELSQIIKDPDAIFTKIYPNNDAHKNQNDDGFYNHISYAELYTKLGKSYLDSLNSCVFVRNPFDTVLSHFYMAARWAKISHIDIKTVDRYFDNDLGLDKLTGLKTRNLYTVNGTIAVNNVLKYENGIESINPILTSLGIESIKNVYREKTYKPSEIKPSDIFLDRHIDIIRNDWAWEFTTFDYSISPVYNS